MSVSRFSNQLRLEGVGMAGMQSLNSAKILVIGVGGIGSAVVVALTAAGAGYVKVIDGDKIEESNLHRQTYYLPADIGKSKAESIAKFARLQNPNCDVTGVNEYFTALLQDHISEVDLVIDCTDNFQARYLINDICIKLNKTWAFGAAEGWTVQVSVFNYENGPSYRCLFPEENPEAPGCNGLGVNPAACSLAASLIVNEAIKIICKTESVLSGVYMDINLGNNTRQQVKFSRNDVAIKQLLAKDANQPDIEVELNSLKPEMNRYVLIDISDDSETFPGAVKSSFYDLIEDTVKYDTSQKYLLICEKGLKSKIIAMKMRERGFLHAFSVRGGKKSVLVDVTSK